MYVVLIPLVNWSFAHVPTLAIPGGGLWSPMAIVTGLILVFRDFAQREVGHYIFIPLLIGLAISYAMAPAAIALASSAAFAISELVDWAIYSFTKKPLSKRVLISSAVSAPLDTAIFWYGANMVEPGVFHWATLATAIASKMAGALLVYAILKQRESRAHDTEIHRILTEPSLIAHPVENICPILPTELLARTHISTTYRVWRKDDVVSVIEHAHNQSIGLLGGNAQLHFAGGIYDLFWLDFDAEQHGFTEPWADYVTRSADETIRAFHDLHTKLDIIDAFRTTYPDVVAKAESLGIDLHQHLYYTLEFWTEEDDLNLDAEQFSEHFTNLVLKNL